MKVTVRELREVELTVNKELIKVSDSGMRDNDSMRLTILYDDYEIGHGHLNLKTNFAHITLNEDNQEMEDYLVNGIEERLISID